MNLTKGNGLTTPHSQPAKTITKYAFDFIAFLLVNQGGGAHA